MGSQCLYGIFFSEGRDQINSHGGNCPWWLSQLSATKLPEQHLISQLQCFVLLVNSDRLFMIAAMASKLPVEERPTEGRLERDVLGTGTSEVIDYSKNLAQNFPVTESLFSVKEPSR